MYTWSQVTDIHILVFTVAPPVFCTPDLHKLFPGVFHDVPSPIAKFQLLLSMPHPFADFKSNEIPERDLRLSKLILNHPGEPPLT
jgi:hypothetical protein